MKWVEKKVAEVCELAYGKSLAAPVRISGEFPVYGSAGEVGTHNQYLVEGPGIIIGRKGSVGTVYFESRNFFPIDTSYYVVPKAENDLRFLYYKFKTLGLDKLNTDAAVPGLNRNVAYEQLSTYPLLPTQLKIASILSAYDDLIENNLKRIKLLEETAQLEFNIILRDNKFLGVSIDELADVVMGQSPTSDTYNDIGDGLPFHQGVTNFSNYFVEHKSYCNKPIKIAEPNDILFSVRAPVGRINFTQDKVCIGRGLCAFKSKKRFQNSLYQQLKTFFFKDDVVGNGAIFNAVTKTELMAIKLNTPSDDVLKSYEEYAEPIYKMILTLSNQNTKLKEARDILLPRLMTGQIEV